MQDSIDFVRVIVIHRASQIILRFLNTILKRNHQTIFSIACRFALVRIKKNLTAYFAIFETNFTFISVLQEISHLKVSLTNSTVSTVLGQYHYIEFKVHLPVTDLKTTLSYQK